MVPDAITRALELRKGTADIGGVTSLTPDMVDALAKEAGLVVDDQPGTVIQYVAFNFDDPILSHREVRQALAYATDRASLIRYLLRGQARAASGLLPPNHWAYEPERSAIPLRSGAGGAAARRGRISARRGWRALSRDDENFDRGIGAPLERGAGRRVETRRRRARPAAARNRDISLRRQPRKLSALHACAGWARTTTPTFSITSSTRNECRRSARIAGIIAIPRSMR